MTEPVRLATLRFSRGMAAADGEWVQADLPGRLWPHDPYKRLLRAYRVYELERDAYRLLRWHRNYDRDWPQPTYRWRDVAHLLEGSEAGG